VLVEVVSVPAVALVVLALLAVGEEVVFVPESILTEMQPVHSRLQVSGISKLPLIPS